MQRGSVVGDGSALYIMSMLTCKLLLQSYIDGRPLHSSMLHVNFYCNRIGMVGLYIFLLGLINIHEMVTWLIKIA